MLHHFRKYQRMIYIVITIVIIISFSFFGTYSTIANPTAPDPVAFNAVDGSQVRRSELDDMALFLGTDSQDKRMFGGVWGPNFLNDGVIVNDFLAKGLATILVQTYGEDLRIDLIPRLEKEKRYTLYHHPQARFLSVTSAWNYFAPEIKKNFDTLRSQKDAASKEAFDARVNLYLSEKKLPSPLLRQILKSQQNQYSGLSQDPNLDRHDFSIFGYHTIEDWFGPRFVRLIAEFVINNAKIAEQRGYKVSKEETLADLMENAKSSFEQNKNSPHLGVTSSEEYFREQLRKMGFDQAKVIKIWRQVLLSRRLFQDLGNSMLVDSLPYEKLNDYAKEFVSGEVYRLPPELHFGNYRDLQKLEIYLNAVSNKSQEKNTLALPTQFLAASDVAKKYPELVQKRYLLEIAEFDKQSLLSKVGIKEMWKWQLDSNNWELLKKYFPQIGSKEADTEEERFSILESLEGQIRSKIDFFSRETIVNQHPEWLEKALAETKKEIVTFSLRNKGGEYLIKGLENTENLRSLLENNEQIPLFSADQRHYYSIQVIDRDSNEEIISFVMGTVDGTLDALLDVTLEAFYQQFRTSRPAEFQNADGSWKKLEDVSDALADHYFATVLKEIGNDYLNSLPAQLRSQHNPQLFTSDFSAAHRLYYYARYVESELKKDPSNSLWVHADKNGDSAKDKLSILEPLESQWKFEKKAFHLTRSDQKGSLIPIEEAYSLSTNEWSSVQDPTNGDITFFQLKQKGIENDHQAISKKMKEADLFLSSNVQQQLMHQIVKIIKDKKAISFLYLNKNEETIERAEDEG